MQQHAERIRRIQALCAQLETALVESDHLKQAAAAPHDGTGAQLDSLDQRHLPRRKSSARQPKTSADDRPCRDW